MHPAIELALQQREMSYGKLLTVSSTFKSWRGPTRTGASSPRQMVPTLQNGGQAWRLPELWEEPKLRSPGDVARATEKVFRSSDQPTTGR